MGPIKDTQSVKAITLAIARNIESYPINPMDHNMIDSLTQLVESMGPIKEQASIKELGKEVHSSLHLEETPVIANKPHQDEFLQKVQSKSIQETSALYKQFRKSIDDFSKATGFQDNFNTIKIGIDENGLLSTLPSVENKSKELEPTSITFNNTKYTFKKQLGHGAQGTAYLVRDDRGKEFVCKKLMIPIYTGDGNHLIYSKEDNIDGDVLREFNIGRQLTSEHLTRCVGVAESNGNAYVLMEKAPGSGADKIAKSQKPDQQSGQKLTSLMFDEICRQVISGVQSMHKMGIYHRDIKPENMNIDISNSETETPNVQVKLLDFGESAQVTGAEVGRDHKTTGTEPYISPKLLQKRIDKVKDNPKYEWEEEDYPTLDAVATGISLLQIYTGENAYFESGNNLFQEEINEPKCHLNALEESNENKKLTENQYELLKGLITGTFKIQDISIDQSGEIKCPQHQDKST